jgi:riboflavin kinase/FMN adenylyltransferase
MEVVNGLFPICNKYSGCCVALGTFDGVHLGHQKIINRVVTAAKSTAGTSVVFTFDPHPRTVLKPHQPLPLITTYEEKCLIIAALGVDLLYTVPFHDSFSRISPEQFIKEVLVDLIRPELVVVGPNYTFGSQGQGSPELLTRLGNLYGFQVEVMESVFIDDKMISSTMIRKLINAGEVETAAKLLARNYSITGKVVHGDGRGRTLGFPTANLDFPSNSVIPADGVYAVRIRIDDELYQGVANIGTNPTFRVDNRRLEVHIFNYTADLYGKDIAVLFQKQLRPERTFAGKDQLIDQIHQDVIQARNILNNCE